MQISQLLIQSKLLRSIEAIRLELHQNLIFDVH